MYCGKCGFDNLPESKFCEKCGSSLGAAAPTPAAGSGLKGSLAGGSSYAPPAYPTGAGGYDYGTYRAPSAGFAPASSISSGGANSAPAASSPVYPSQAPAYTPEVPVYNSETASAPEEMTDFIGKNPTDAASAYHGGSGYSAPAYTAPTYPTGGYAAPTYSAPTYSAPTYSAPTYSAPTYSPSAAPSYTSPAAPTVNNYYGYNAASVGGSKPFPIITLIGALVAIVAMFLEFIKYTDGSMFVMLIGSIANLGDMGDLGELGIYIILMVIGLAVCAISTIVALVCACRKKSCRGAAILGIVFLFITLFAPLVFGVSYVSGYVSIGAGDIFAAMGEYIKVFGLGAWLYFGGMLVAAIGGGNH